MASQAQVLEAYDRQTRINRSLREKARKAAEDTLNAVATVGGGAGAGYIDGKWPDKKFLGVGANFMLGAGATILGLSGIAGRHSGAITALGSGVLAAVAYKEVKARTPAAKKSESSGVGYLPPGHRGVSVDQMMGQFRRMAEQPR